MHIIHNRQHPQRQLVLFCSMLALILMLAACGSNAGTTGGGGGQTPTPTTPPTSGPVKGYGTSVGCPSDMVVNSAPTQANVLIQLTNMDSTVTAHVGDIIEVRLPFGHKWGGPGTALHGLQLQPPAGYAWKADNVCIWRFVAKGTGTTQLLFQSQPLCKPGEMCPMYITAIPFTVVVR